MTRLAFAFIITVIGLAFTPTASLRAAHQTSAQTASAPSGTPQAQLPERAVQRLEQIKERLALTPEQIEQVRPIWTEEARKLKALRDKHGANAGGGSRRDRLKIARELRDIQNDTDDQLEKVLSKDQMKELKKLRDEWRQQLRERAGER